jgi:hypothetical protein
MVDKEQYKGLITDIIGKQSIILGPQIAILKARNVAELAIDNDGKVTDINGDPAVALQKLIDEYVELSGLIVKNALGSIFAKYPTIKKIE